MTPDNIKLIHTITAQKGLDRTLYKDNLHAVGVESCLDMKQQQFADFLARMKRLPNIKIGKKA